MVIPYQTAKLKSTNIFAMAIWDPTAKCNSCQYFRLYGSLAGAMSPDSLLPPLCVIDLQRGESLRTRPLHVSINEEANMHDSMGYCQGHVESCIRGSISPCYYILLSSQDKHLGINQLYKAVESPLHYRCVHTVFTGTAI